MTNVIKNIAGLEETIELLEQKRIAEQNQLTDSLRNKMDSLKPRNLIRSSITEFKINKSFKQKVVLLTLGVVGTVILKRIIPGRNRSGLKAVVVGAVISGLIKAAMSNRRQHPRTS